MIEVNNKLNKTVVFREFVGFYFENKGLIDLLQKANQSEAVRQLHQTVCNERQKENLTPLSVRFISAEEAKSDRAYASANCNMSTGVITIRSDLPFVEKLHSLVFELGNLSQKKTKDEIEEEIKQRKIKTSLECARRIEEMEYKTAQICADVFDKSVIKGEWELSLISVPDRFINFDDYWEKATAVGHVQYYIDRFEEFLKNKPPSL